jgi:hypothetical protein
MSRTVGISENLEISGAFFMGRFVVTNLASVTPQSVQKAESPPPMEQSMGIPVAAPSDAS